MELILYREPDCFDGRHRVLVERNVVQNQGHYHDKVNDGEQLDALLSFDALFEVDDVSDHRVGTMGVRRFLMDVFFDYGLRVVSISEPLVRELHPVQDGQNLNCQHQHTVKSKANRGHVDDLVEVPDPIGPVLFSAFEFNRRQDVGDV